MLSQNPSYTMKDLLGEEGAINMGLFTLRRLLTLSPNVAQVKLLQSFNHFQLKLKNITRYMKYRGSSMEMFL